MHHTPYWRDALIQLHFGGWDTDDIDAACEVLVEACEERAALGLELAALTPAEVEDILDIEVEPDEVPALLVLADLLASEDEDAEALREALDDIDAFANAYADVG